MLYREIGICHIGLLWFLNGLDVVGMFVDHIDGDKHNNRIDNLRRVTVAGNQRNQKINSRNTTGISGIIKISIPNGSGTKINNYYEAIYYDSQGSHHRKKFSIEKYGDSLAKNLAVEFRMLAIEQLNSEYNTIGSFGYTERHYNEATTSN